MMGSGYVIEHCVTAFSDICRQKAVEIYITDGIRCISESVAKAFGGSYMTERFADLVNNEHEEERTGDEIALDIITRAGLKTRGNEE